MQRDNLVLEIFKIACALTAVDRAAWYSSLPMKKNITKKLSLRPETLKTLEASSLKLVAGAGTIGCATGLASGCPLCI